MYQKTSIKLVALIVFLNLTGLSAEKIDCGQHLNDTFEQKTECWKADCIWDENAIEGEPWCYKFTDVDGEHSLGSSERNSYKKDLDIKITNAAIQYSGYCLFYCTSIPQENRISCGRKDITMESCLRGGCCWDENEVENNKKCFHSAPIKNSCPSDQCQIPNGQMQQCFETRRDDLTMETCKKSGCCAVFLNGKTVCYKKQDKPLIKSNYDEYRGQFIETLKENRVDIDTLSLIDLLSKEKEELLKITRPKTTATTTTTEVATTKRTTTPAPTTEKPTKVKKCRWFKCWWETVPQEPKKCYPSDCGSPKYYPGSPLTLPKSSSLSDDKSSLLKKIVGGSRAYPFSHPWTAMVLKWESGKKFLCGASIICKHWLVTAAHCTNRQSKQTSLPDLDTQFYEVHVGRFMGPDHEAGKQVQKFVGHEGIDRIVIHDNFTSGVSRGIITNDIALIKLKQPIEFNNFVQPVCLPKVSAKENDILWATGWGDTKFQGPSNKNMKQIGIKVKNESVCEAQVSGFKKYKPQGVLCAGGEKMQDTCTGDSGGPLVGPKIHVHYSGMKKVSSYKWQLFGLTSIGSPSCNTRSVDTQPAIYTNVNYFLDWIAKKTQNCCA